VEGGLGCSLQGDGGIVLQQPRIDLVVRKRHLAQSLVGALLQRGRCLFALRLSETQLVLQQAACVERPFELQQRGALRLGDREIGRVVHVEPAEIALHVRAQRNFRGQSGACGRDFGIRRAQLRHVGEQVGPPPQRLAEHIVDSACGALRQWALGRVRHAQLSLSIPRSFASAT
jgi:hypothetical protein